MGGIMRRVGLAAGCVALMGGLAACSDDTETLSEEEFLEQANEICRAGSAELDERAEELFSDAEPTPEQLGEFADFFEENIGEQIDAVDDLEGPSDLEEQLEPLIDDSREALDEFVTGLREDPESVFTGEDPFAEPNEGLSALGLTACGDSE